MIPLRDLTPAQTQPVLTWGLIGINVAVFLLTWGDLNAAAANLGAVAYHFTGATPEVEFDNQVIVPKEDFWPTRTLSHMFVHGSFLHILGNMWFLHVFGDNVEDRLGRLRFVLLYLGAGLVALASQVIADPDSGIPMVGASGAVAGVLGAYLRLFPHSRVLTLVPLGFILTTFVWPAFVFLGIWIVMQVVNAALTRGMAGGGVAWFAHIGGFALGWLVGKALAKPDPRIRAEIGGRRVDDDRW